jgi:hypothetical protein
MANVTNFQVSNIMGKVSDYAPFILLAMAVGTFLTVGIFRTDYYNHIFAVRFEPWAAMAMAVFASIIEEGVRLALLVSSIRDFSDSRKGNGWLGLVASVALVWYEISTTQHVAELWATGEAAAVSTYKGFLVFMVLLGLVLEMRLILTVPGASLGKPSSRAGRPGSSSNGKAVVPTAWGGIN